MNKLSSFLIQHRVKDVNTHNSSASPKGAFEIGPEKIQEFVNLYNATLADGNELYITERCPPKFSPIKIDIDLNFPYATEDEKEKEPKEEPKSKQEEDLFGELEEKLNLEAESKKLADEGKIKDRYYTIDHIKKFLKYYKQTLEDCIKIEDIEDYRAFVMEKPRATKKSKNNIGDGFHIVFPGIVCSHAIQLYVREKMINSGKVKEIFENTECKNEPGDIFDKGVIERNWTMYGSRGKCGGSVYSVSHIYELSKTDTSYEGFIKREIPFEGLDKTNWPILLSVRNKENNSNFKNDDLAKIIDEWYYKKYEKRRITKQKELGEDIDIAFVRKLVGILSPNRAKGYEDWIRVCWALHNISSTELFEDFIEFSKKCPEKFDMEGCAKTWNRSNNDGLKIGSIHYWAKNDNPEAYQTIMNEDAKSLLLGIPDTPVGISRVMHRLYKHEFICTEFQSTKETLWFQFKEHRWKNEGCDELRNKIHTEIKEQYRRLYEFVKFKLGTEQKADMEGGYSKESLVKINKIMKKLEDTPYIQNIMTECKYIFKDKNMPNKIDSNPYLIGFNNGVYDLEHFMFREGLPEDWITKCTGVDYFPFNDSKNEYIEDVRKFMDDILPNSAVRDYCLYVLSTCLVGENDQQKIYLFIGEGGNGKSVLNNILIKSLGDYHATMNVAYITQKRDGSSKPSPDVMELVNRRVGIFSEPDKGDTLNMGILKSLTGEDEICARPLFGKPIKFVNKAKIIILCNDPPVPSSQGQAETRRFRVIHFPCRFVENPTEENEKQLDITLNQRTKKWPSSFLSLLINYYQDLKENKGGIIPEPPEVVEYTAQFRERTNWYLQFVHESLRESTDPKAMLSSVELFRTFKVWFALNFPGSKMPPKPELIDFLKKNYKKKMTNNALKGYEIIETKDEETQNNTDNTEKPDMIEI